MVPPPPPPTSSNLGTELEEGSHLPPLVEEIRTQGASSGAKNCQSGKNKRTIAFVAILVAVIALVVGFTVSAVQNNRKSSSSNVSKSQDLNNNALNKDGAPNVTDDMENDDIERLDQIHIFILGSGISSESDLKDTSKPQYKAAQWIANEDESDIPETNDYATSYSFVQRYVMAVFYYALNGPSWSNQLNFLSTALNTCDWNLNIDVIDPPPGTNETNFDFGVSCWDKEAGEYSDVVTYIFISTYFEQPLLLCCGYMLDLHSLTICSPQPAAKNNLEGSLPSEMGELIDLVHLSLFNNKISGSIPDSMKNLVRLNYWAMESNQISGKIPSWIGQMPSLTNFALADNLLTGMLPSFVDSKIEELTLNANNLGGPIDPLNDASFLQIAYLGDNLFKSELTETTFENLYDLDIVGLQDNQLYGTFPSTFYWLSEVDVSNNTLSGMSLVAPDGFLQLPIRFLSVANNNMNCTIPNNIGSLVKLTVLDLSRNYFNGTIPITIDDLVLLEALYLFQNPELTDGWIPDFRSCSNLVEISLAVTNRSGKIPSWFSDFADLEVLDLQGNHLSGSIPSYLGDLANLSYLYLNQNQLTGTVPSQLRFLSNLGMWQYPV
jgi:Leucine-rich repeat (LRR) protein